MTDTALKWKSDIFASFHFINQAVSDHPMPVIFYLITVVLAGVLPPIEFLAKLLGQLALLGVGCAVSRSAWSDQLLEEERKTFQISHGGIPVLSLIFLQILFYAPLILPPLLLTLFFRHHDLSGGGGQWLIPLSYSPLFIFSVWWSVKSALALPIIAVEDYGAITALMRSHGLLNHRLQQAFRYLSAIFIVCLVPLLAFFLLMQYGYRTLMDQAVTLPIAIGGMAVKSLLEGACYFATQMVITACITRLYASFAATETGKENEIPV